MTSADVLSFDALISDIGKLNDTLNFDDLHSVLNDIFTGDQKDFSQLKACKKLSNRSLKGKPSCTLSVFFCWLFVIAAIASCFCILIPNATHQTIDFMGGMFNVKGSHLHALQDDFLNNCVQMIRKATVFLKVQEFFSVTDLDFDECVVENPLYKAWHEVKDCEYYEGIEEPFYASDGSFEEKDEWMEHPVITFEGRGMESDLKQLQQLLIKSTVMMNSDTVSVSSSSPNIRTIEDLMKIETLEHLHKDSGIHVVGKSLSYLSSHMLKPVSPNLREMFENAVLGSYKSMFLIDGPESPPYMLKPTYKGRGFHCIYSQASGSRRLVFSPIQECANTARSFSVIMKPKDIITYLKEAWTVHSEPHDETLGSSLSFLSEFEEIQ